MSRRVTIAGGGLAGLSLGIALRRRGVDVTLHEAGAYPRHRVCGEFISGVRPETLDRLGILDALAPARSLSSAHWYRYGNLLLAQDLPEPARGLSRYGLDERLKNLFEKTGGEFYPSSRLSRNHPDPVVWCAGRVPSRGCFIGLKCHARGLPLAADLEMHLGRGGYLGLARLAGGLVNLCGLFRVAAAISDKGPRLLLAYLRAAGLPVLAGRLAAAELDPSSFLGVAGFSLGWQPEDSRHLALGDACAMIPPFTGNGMSMAFESAEMALDPLVSYSRGRSDWAETASTVRRALARRFRFRLLAARALHPFLLNSVGQVLLASLSRANLLPAGTLFRALR